jgi:quercetin dioxygenase-like cupin family protein
MRSTSVIGLTLGSFLVLLTAAADVPAPFVVVKPDDVKWTGQPGGIQNAIIAGDPTKPGVYVVRVKFPPGIMTRPHTHAEDRYATVLKGTWWVNTGNEFHPETATPLGAGTFMKHPAGEKHYDGAKDEEVIVQIIGIGPSSTTPVDAAKGMTGKSVP